MVQPALEIIVGHVKIPPMVEIELAEVLERKKEQSLVLDIPWELLGQQFGGATMSLRARFGRSHILEGPDRVLPGFSTSLLPDTALPANHPS